MRYATNALSTGDHETPLQVCDFVRTVKTRACNGCCVWLNSVFDSIPESTLYKLKKKQEETTRSLEKIEKGEVCRGSERATTPADPTVHTRANDSVLHSSIEAGRVWRQAGGSTAPGQKGDGRCQHQRWRRTAEGQQLEVESNSHIEQGGDNVVRYMVCIGFSTRTTHRVAGMRICAGV